MSTNSINNLEKRLQAYPQLKAKIEALLSVVENKDQSYTLAALAEQQIIEEIRLVGQQALQSWAEAEQRKQAIAYREKKPNLRQHAKKNFTGIVVLEG